MATTSSSYGKEICKICVNNLKKYYRQALFERINLFHINLVKRIDICKNLDNDSIAFIIKFFASIYQLHYTEEDINMMCGVFLLLKIHNIVEYKVIDYIKKNIEYHSDGNIIDMYNYPEEYSRDSNILNIEHLSPRNFNSNVKCIPDNTFLPRCFYVFDPFNLIYVHHVENKFRQATYFKDMNHPEIKKYQSQFDVDNYIDIHRNNCINKSKGRIERDRQYASIEDMSKKCPKSPTNDWVNYPVSYGGYLRKYYSNDSGMYDFIYPMNEYTRALIGTRCLYMHITYDLGCVDTATAYTWIHNLNIQEDKKNELNDDIHKLNQQITIFTGLNYSLFDLDIIDKIYESPSHQHINVDGWSTTYFSNSDKFSSLLEIIINMYKNFAIKNQVYNTEEIKHVLTNIFKDNDIINFLTYFITHEIDRTLLNKIHGSIISRNIQVSRFPSRQNPRVSRRKGGKLILDEEQEMYKKKYLKYKKKYLQLKNSI